MHERKTLKIPKPPRMYSTVCILDPEVLPHVLPDASNGQGQASECYKVAVIITSEHGDLPGQSRNLTLRSMWCILGKNLLSEDLTSN